MRTETKDTKDKIGNSLGPISHAVTCVNRFNCSASGWTKEHLTRFQIIVLNDLTANHLFPDEFIPSDSDSTMSALKSEGFFKVPPEAISRGGWKKDELFHFVFLYMMMLMRGDRTPSPRTSPKIHDVLPRDAKEAAKREMVNIYAPGEQKLSPLVYVVSGTSINSQQSSQVSSMFRPSLSTIDSRPIIDHGPRETLSFSLFHQFLSYLGTIEHRNAKGGTPVWIPWY
jgi:hypothetical protein